MCEQWHTCQYTELTSIRAGSERCPPQHSSTECWHATQAPCGQEEFRCWKHNNTRETTQTCTQPQPNMLVSTLQHTLMTVAGVTHCKAVKFLKVPAAKVLRSLVLSTIFLLSHKAISITRRRFYITYTWHLTQNPAFTNTHNKCSKRDSLVFVGLSSHTTRVFFVGLSKRVPRRQLLHHSLKSNNKAIFNIKIWHILHMYNIHA